MDLEQITKAAGAYAMNCWWQAHDEKDWEKVKDHVMISESVLTRYTGKPIDSKAAGESFVEALKAYDDYTAVLKKDGFSDVYIPVTEKDKIQEHLQKYYSALGLTHCAEDLAHATTQWWTSFAKSRTFYKLGDIDSYESADNEATTYLTDEHAFRFGLDEDTASGLAHLMHAACNLGHNKKDYAKAEQLVKVYAIELFSAISKQN
jgi:hypothetical protein